jgi:hypothetical protein
MQTTGQIMMNLDNAGKTQWHLMDFSQAVLRIEKIH